MNSTHDAKSVKLAARGLWCEILAELGGLPIELLRDPHRHGPCPKCGGTDRFRAFDNVAETGGVICNQCRTSSDGFAALQWATGKSFADTLRDVADFLGIKATTCGQQFGIVEAVARAKRMRLDAFLLYGAQAQSVMRGREKTQVARVPMHDGDGKPCSHFDLTPKTKGYCAKGLPAGVFLPGRKPQAGETWLVVEGVKDAAALAGVGFDAVGLPTCKMSPSFSGLFAGAHVVIVPDLDAAGQSGANLTASRLHGIAASVRVARLPGEIVESKGADVRDILAKPDGEKLLRDAITNALSWRPQTAERERPEIEITLDETRVVEEVIPLLAELGWTLNPEATELRTFQRRGELVHVVTDAEPVGGIELPERSRRIRPLPAMLIRERIGAAARLFVVKNSDEGSKSVYKTPPQWLVGMIGERGQYPRCIRPLSGVVQSPTMRADGSIAQLAGYDEATWLLIELADGWPTIPEKPTRDAAKKAAESLLEVVADFPFVGPAHASAWVAFVLTLLARPAIRGPAPLFLFDASTRGTGKSLAADAAGIIATGDKLPRKSWTLDDETRKTITAVALEGLGVVLLDNVAGRLGCASLDAALTATSWSDRVLGMSRTTGTLSLNTVWCATETTSKWKPIQRGGRC
jgi:hypothetical protein